MRFVLGLLWGMTPCALVYGVLPVAMFAGSAPDGALVMLAFGLGTLPNLAFAGAALGVARRWLQRPIARHAAATLVAAFGIASDGAFANYVTGSYWASDVTVGDVTLTNADGSAEDPSSDGLVFKISE